jgi:hypothetical protein
VAGFYDVLLHDVASRLEAYLAQTDELLDAPSVEIIRRILADLERMQRDRRAFGSERPDVVHDAEWVDRLRQAVGACRELVNHREGVTP